MPSMPKGGIVGNVVIDGKGIGNKRELFWSNHLRNCLSVIVHLWFNSVWRVPFVVVHLLVKFGIRTIHENMGLTPMERLDHM